MGSKVARHPGEFNGLRGQQRLEIVQLHRLLEFDEIFALYLRGQATAEQVKLRADKMLAVGLPKLR
jgi:hypothetical protein